MPARVHDAGGLIEHKFNSTVKIPAATSVMDRRPIRISVAVSARRNEIELAEYKDDKCILRRSHEPYYSELIRIQDPDDKASRLAGSGNSDGGRNLGMSPEQELTTARNSLQSSFTHMGQTETSNFNGVLSELPEFDLWEECLRSFCSESPNLSEKSRVMLIKYALDRAALRFFHKHIVPSSFKIGSSLENRNLGSAHANSSPT